jgi:alpha-tubulin suppressor-like RCC1 family protein
MTSERSRVAALVLIATVGCSEGPVEPQASAVTVSAAVTTIDLGDELPVSVSAVDANGSELNVARTSWRSSDTTTIQVDTGIARAVGVGRAWVVAQVGGRADSIMVPVELRRIGAQDFVTVDAGASHACMLTAANAAYCVGRNGSGELGDGTQTDRDVPVLVGAAENLARISAGDRHTCGIGVSGTMYCWGLNSLAQLGSGATSAPVVTPTPVVGALQFVRLVASDHLYTCGLTGDGTGYCWGHNDQSQLGRAPAIRIDSAVAPISGGQLFSEIDAGSFHSCALSSDGSAYCWGYAGAGALGNGVAQEARFATPMLVSQTLRFGGIATGVSHTCGVTLAFETYCWGSNDGKLGGTTVDGNPHPAPTRIQGDPGFVSVTAGIDHSCGLTATGEAYCWGLNSRGQLGNFYMSHSYAPTPLAPGVSFRSLSAGRYSTCGVTIGGALYCWPATFAP